MTEMQDLEKLVCYVTRFRRGERETGGERESRRDRDGRGRGGKREGMRKQQERREKGSTYRNLH